MNLIHGTQLCLAAGTLGQDHGHGQGVIILAKRPRLSASPSAKRRMHTQALGRIKMRQRMGELRTRKSWYGSNGAGTAASVSVSTLARLFGLFGLVGWLMRVIED